MLYGGGVHAGRGEARKLVGQRVLSVCGGIRSLSRGAVNYKILYALVGTNGRYVNHSNALVRKRTAAAFSRLIHSSRYADDLRESYHRDDEVFSYAASELVEELRRTSEQDDAAIMDALLGTLMDGVQQGLLNEQLSGRMDVSRMRLRRELGALSAWCHAAKVGGEIPLEELVAAIFHLLAFGRLDERFARTCSMPRRPREQRTMFWRMS